MYKIHIFYNINQAIKFFTSSVTITWIVKVVQTLCKIIYTLYSGIMFEVVIKT